MERETTKHNPELDDVMKREQPSVSHGSADEGHHWAAGGPGEEQPVDFRRRTDDLPDTTLDHDEAELRADIARSLHRTVWPADKPTLVRDAASNDPPEHVIAQLDRLPANDAAYENVEAIWTALGGTVEQRS